MSRRSQTESQGPWGAPPDQFPQAPEAHRAFQPPVHSGLTPQAPGGEQHYAPGYLPQAQPGQHPASGYPSVGVSAAESPQAPTKKGRGAKKTAKKSPPPKKQQPQEIPESLQQIPRPGSRYAGGRGKHVTVKTVAAITVCCLALCGAMAVGAFGFREIQKPPVLKIGQADQVRFGLDTFPVSSAAAFAERYVRTCLDSAGDDSLRRTTIRAMSTDGVPDDCGWPVGGPTVTVVSSTFTGILGTVPGYDDDARFVGVQTILSDSRTLDLVLPVWTSPDAPGGVFMAVGPLGNNPLPASVKVDPITVTEEDSALAITLQTGVFTEFFTAWGSSNASVLDRFATKDASIAVRAGLSGTLGYPTVSRVTVRVPDGETLPYNWSEGDVAIAEVTVAWSVEQGGPGATFVYRVNVLNTGDGWSVADIAGGGVDVRGSSTDPIVPTVTPEGPEEG